jgi:predicted hotdog family 3-hydroxylacyl-ACP dehydratase
MPFLNQSAILRNRAGTAVRNIARMRRCVLANAAVAPDRWRGATHEKVHRWNDDFLVATATVAVARKTAFQAERIFNLAAEF